MKEENHTFSRQEARPINNETIMAAVKALENNKKAEFENFTELLYNGDVLELFKSRITPNSTPSTAHLFYGFPLSKRSYVPMGELWIVDKDGKVIQKFKVTN